MAEESQPPLPSYLPCYESGSRVLFHVHLALLSCKHAAVFSVKMGTPPVVSACVECERPSAAPQLPREVSLRPQQRIALPGQNPVSASAGLSLGRKLGPEGTSEMIKSRGSGCQNYLEDLPNCRLLDPTPRVSEQVGLGWGPRLDASHRLPGDTDAAGPRTMF